jgi:hypothetical protein
MDWAEQGLVMPHIARTIDSNVEAAECRTPAAEAGSAAQLTRAGSEKIPPSFRQFLQLQLLMCGRARRLE